MLGSSRNRLGPLALLAAALWLMGLGGGTDSSQTPIPIPQQNYTVTVTDSTGKALEARRFTWEGKVNLRGQVGNATVTLPFAKIRSIAVKPAPGEQVGSLMRADVTLRSGDTVEVLIDRSTKCYGETKFGDYEIFFKDVASIAFQ